MSVCVCVTVSVCVCLCLWVNVRVCLHTHVCPGDVVSVLQQGVTVIMVRVVGNDVVVDNDVSVL